jgi:WD40 repeat protein
MVTTEGARSRGPDEDRVFLERLSQIERRGAKDDRFRVLAEIAQGGMGRVLRVYDEDLRRELAMKVIRLGAMDQDTSSVGTETRENLALFLEEVQITGQLNHPSVVPVHDIGVNARGELYYLMPLLRGVDLKAGIERFRRGEAGWTLPRVIEVICRAAQVVEHAHQRGVVHRDLKPANVMIGDLGEIWVLDWGLAQLERRPFEDGVTGVDSETHLLLRTGGLVGTPGYMAPEQVEGVAGTIGPRADVYALGAILYHVLTGEMPYVSPPQTCAADMIVQRTLAGPPLRVHELAATAQPELVAICEKAMQRGTEQRYESALAMANDLRAWLEGRVVSTYEVGVLGTFRKWRRRNRAAARALDALAVVALVGSLAFAIQQKRHALAVERANVEEMRANHAANLRAADLSIQGCDAREARRLLDLCPRPMRGWEWHWLAARTDDSVARLAGHGQNVLGLSIDAAGRRAASWDVTGDVWLWELAQRSGRRLPLDRSDRVRSPLAVALDPTGCVLAAIVGDSSVALLTVDGAQAPRTLELTDGAPCALAWSPDGKLLACGMSSGAVAIVDVVGARPACAPLDTGTDDAIGVRSLSFAPDGESIVVCHELQPPRVWRWRDAGSHPPCVLGEFHANGTSFSPDGARIVVAGPSQTVAVYSALTGVKLSEFDCDSRSLDAATFTRDGACIVTVGSDHALRVWKPETAEPLATRIGHVGAIHALARIGESDEFVTCSVDRTLRIWRPLAPHVGLARIATPEFLALSRSSSDETLYGVATDGRVGTIGADGVELRGAPVPDRFGLQATIDSARGHALIGNSAGRLELRRLGDGGVERSDPVFDAAVSAVALDPGGRCSAAGSHDGQLVVLARTSGDRLLRSETSRAWITALAFAPARAGAPRLAVARWKEGLSLVEPFEGGTTRALGASAHDWCTLTWSSDGTQLVAGAFDGKIWLVDPEGHAPPLEFGAHDEMVQALWLSPDGTRLYSASRDCTLRIWDPRYAVPLLTLSAPGLALDTLTADSNGDRIACSPYPQGETESSVLVWSLPPVARSAALPAKE